jgi:hypothetical protein
VLSLSVEVLIAWSKGDDDRLTKDDISFLIGRRCLKYDGGGHSS